MLDLDIAHPAVADFAVGHRVVAEFREVASVGRDGELERQMLDADSSTLLRAGCSTGCHSGCTSVRKGRSKTTRRAALDGLDAGDPACPHASEI